MDDWHLFVDWAMKGLLGGMVGYGIHVLSGMKGSIDQLNVKVGTIIERTEWHSKEIDRLGNRLLRVESRDLGKASQSTCLSN